MAAQCQPVDGVEKKEVAPDSFLQDGFSRLIKQLVGSWTPALLQ
jgi:hypothetical protein